MTARRRLKKWAESLKLGFSFSMYQFVLDHGREFSPKQSKDRGVPKYCFHNAHIFCRRGLRYVEGYAFMDKFPIPFHHAWLCRPGSDEALEVTTDRLTHYIGVEFRPEYQRKAYRRGLRKDNMSLIDTWSDGWKLLRMSDDELEKAIVSQRSLVEA